MESASLIENEHLQLPDTVSAPQISMVMCVSIWKPLLKFLLTVSYLTVCVI